MKALRPFSLTIEERRLGRAELHKLWAAAAARPRKLTPAEIKAAIWWAFIGVASILCVWAWAGK